MATDTLAERLGLWEPCKNPYCTCGDTPASFCPICQGTGRVLNHAAVKAAWAIVADAERTVWECEGERLKGWVMEIVADLKAVGAERPKEASDAE